MSSADIIAHRRRASSNRLACSQSIRDGAGPRCSASAACNSSGVLHLAISGSRPQDGINKRLVRVLDTARMPRTPIGDAPDMEEAAEERRVEEAVRMVGSHESVDWTTRRGD